MSRGSQGHHCPAVILQRLAQGEHTREEIPTLTSQQGAGSQESSTRPRRMSGPPRCPAPGGPGLASHRLGARLNPENPSLSTCPKP